MARYYIQPSRAEMTQKPVIIQCISLKISQKLLPDLTTSELISTHNSHGLHFPCVVHLPNIHQFHATGPGNVLGVALAHQRLIRGLHRIHGVP